MHHGRLRGGHKPVLERRRDYPAGFCVRVEERGAGPLKVFLLLHVSAQRLSSLPCSLAPVSTGA